MRVLAVPVKRLDRSKTRLASFLSPPERAVLTLAMLEDVLEACLSQKEWEVWVVSSDEAVQEVAVRRGARSVPDQAGSLNGAVRQIEREVRGASATLAVVLADLPLVTAEALGEVLGDKAKVAAAPAASDGGTNVLVRRPASVIPARFGRHSFASHRWAARRARVAFRQVDVPDLAFDLDRPEDLRRVLSAGRRGRTRTACLEMALPERLRERA